MNYAGKYVWINIMFLISWYETRNWITLYTSNPHSAVDNPMERQTEGHAENRRFYRRIFFTDWKNEQSSEIKSSVYTLRNDNEYTIADMYLYPYICLFGHSSSHISIFINIVGRQSQWMFFILNPPTQLLVARHVFGYIFI